MIELKSLYLSITYLDCYITGHINTSKKSIGLIINVSWAHWKDLTAWKPTFRSESLTKQKHREREVCLDGRFHGHPRSSFLGIHRLYLYPIYPPYIFHNNLSGIIQGIFCILFSQKLIWWVAVKFRRAIEKMARNY